MHQAVRVDAASSDMSNGRRLFWRALQGALLIITLAWAGVALSRQWQEVRASAAITSVNWGWIGVASLIVLATCIRRSSRASNSSSRAKRPHRSSR